MRSAIITAYREEGVMEKNIRALLDHGYEVVLAIDCPNDRLKEIVERYPVKATVSDKRRGKWRALNDALRLVNGDEILFLDSDTEILSFTNLNGKDAIEIRKEIEGESLMERLVNLDYFVMFVTAKLAEKLNSCLSINGSAFMIKKRVLDELGGFKRKINEDTDLGARLGLRGFKVGVDGRAVTRAPKSFRDWFVQRERWSLGGAEVVLDYFWDIAKRPRLWLPYLFVFYPAFVGFVLSMLLPDSLILKLLYFLIPLMVFLSPKLLSLAMLMLFEIHTLRNILIVFLSFLLWSITIVALSKYYDYRVDFKLLPIYYFFYSPLWAIICVVSFFRVLCFRFLRKRMDVKGWKV